jgi:hypothetical protein
MSVHSATPYFRWVFEAVAIVGTIAPANRRVFSETMATTQICTGIQAFRKENFVARNGSRRCITTANESIAARLPRQYRNEHKFRAADSAPNRTRKCEAIS